MHDGVPDSVSPKAELAPRWLEEITDPKTASWVAQHNESTRQLLGSPSLNTLVSEIRDLLDNPDRMPVVTDHHGMLYNLWTDAAHPRGLWRRTTWESYVQGAPGRADRTPPATQWEELADLDALAAEKGADLSWAGAQVLSTGPHAGRRALISLADGGSDASTTQEYDLDKRRFISPRDGGFCQMLSKGTMSWADDVGESVLISDDFTGTGMSRAGLPRQVRRLKRGQHLEDAEVLVTAASDALAAFAVRDPWGRTWVSTVPYFGATSKPSPPRP